MTDPRRPIFTFLAPYLKPPGWSDKALLEGMDRHLDLLGVARVGATGPAAVAERETLSIAVPGASGPLTPRIALELVGHEAIVQEAYKDSVGVWTWGVGVTSASGHSVERYKDNPQPIAKCLEVYIWLLREKYLPDVLTAFGRALTEAQLGAALSFHYNTGAIKRASWVKKWLAGDIAGARLSFMEWRRPPEISKRREAERDLFFDGKWSGDGKATVYAVRKPSYAPNWGSARRVDIRADLAEAMK